MPPSRSSLDARPLTFLLATLLVCGLGAWLPAAAWAEGADAPGAVDAASEAASSDDTTEPLSEAPIDSLVEPLEDVVFDAVTVVGTAEQAARVPGSAHVVTAEEMSHQLHTDIHRILRQVPGVVVQEEDGYGLRPNIGMRGTGVERSQKISLLEDGVPMSPAPYAAPAAYFSPGPARRQSIEVRKGSAAIQQGPHTNGGVINYLTTPIPGEWQGKLRAAGGSDETLELHGSYGGSTERWGFLIEAFRQETDGFKDLDGAERNGGSTGFALDDIVAKLRWSAAADARIPQQLELKVGRTEQDGDETYLGLTEADFEATPFRRYLGSAADRIDADHDDVSLRWVIQPSSRVDVTTTIYRNEFFRDWFKNEKTLGVSNRSILADPERYADELALLRGEVDGPDDAFALRHNRRDYLSQGVQTTVGWSLGSDRVRHELEAGVRWHEDEEDRFQEEDGFTVRDGALIQTSSGAPGSQANRVGEAEALAFFVRDEITVGRWVIAPGVRYETIDTRRTDFAKDDPLRVGETSMRSNEVDAWMPGLGVSYAPNDRWTLFGGVHRGFAPPGPSSREGVEPEENVAWEAGVRFLDPASPTSRGPRSLELVGFFSDYSNLLGADTLSGGGAGTGEQFNGGAVDVWGLEATAGTMLYAREGLRLPVRATYTWTRAEFQSSFETSFADWAPVVEAGDELPYLPEHQLWAEIGLETGRWSTYVSGSWIDAMRTRAGDGPVPADEEIEAHLVFDGSLRYALLDRLSLDLRVRNLTDEVYVVARRPYGLRPGLSRTVLVGATLGF